MSVGQGFDRIIKAYFHDRPGARYVERGDYRISSAEDGQVVGPSQLTSAAEAGIVLEMSIILRQEADTEKCPRCSFMNSRVTTIRGWIEWRVPLMDRQVSEINIVSCSSNCSGRFQVTDVDGHDESGTSCADDEDEDDEVGGTIISPASYVFA
jgi:Ubiquitin-like domain